MKIGPITISINNCTAGIYLRWFYNGWHYFNFQNGYEITMTTESVDTQVTRMFSRISKVERPTKLKSEYSYQVTLEGITANNIAGFTGLFLAEKVEQYEGSTWYKVDITRGDHLIKNADTDAYIFNFEITRKELPNSSTVMQNSILLYLNDTLCDLDDDEVIPINKQVNDIAEMQDRQSDFTQQFRIQKTRAMRALFELSGEVDANTTFPYEKQTCRLVIDAVEIITDGNLILDDVDKDYYYVSVYSGNTSFFKAIEGLKITDLTLASTNHTWNIVTMAATHASDLDYVYPLMEPSDDAGLVTNVDPDPDIASIWGGYIWPFVKVKAIWDEIFSNAGYTVTGDILTDEKFLKLFIPIANRTVSIFDKSVYQYSLRWDGWVTYTGALNNLYSAYGASITLLNGSTYWKDWQRYIIPFAGTYRIRIGLNVSYQSGLATTVWVYSAGVPVVTLEKTGGSGSSGGIYEGEYDATHGETLRFYISPINAMTAWSIAITEITVPYISYGTPVTPHLNLPNLSQTEFIKMICNMFALIPEATPRDKIINFWNYGEIYDNIPVARSWEKYLSETDDHVQFKFGDYAQSNYLRYKDSDDVTLDQGVGIMLIEDTTLQDEKEVVQLPLATCDEVTILSDVVVSRIDMNKWDEGSSLYVANDDIDPRIVYISNVGYSATSPLYEKTLRLRSAYSGGTTEDIVTPKKASSLEISFSQLVVNYSFLSRMLTKTNLRKSKFNLPVFEVAGLNYKIPIYIPQYKAYFYVNKVNNYVEGQLCPVDLIKL